MLASLRPNVKKNLGAETREIACSLGFLKEHNARILDAKELLKTRSPLAPTSICEFCSKISEHGYWLLRGEPRGGHHPTPTSTTSIILIN